ncbi:MAG TPA: hypothetical protein VKZ59_07220 [Acidobacteriota bacterium]|nr:hypothetical protein [Acidobacteriota bacterium]
MKKLALLLALLLLLIGGAYWAYQDPKVRSLFATSSERPENPLDFLEDLPEITPRPEATSRNRSSAGRRAPAQASQSQASEQQPQPENQVANEEVARVMMQILAAKGLASGINLAVTDEKVILSGEVFSQEQRQAIIDTVQKGREARQVDASGLKVNP